MLKIGVTGGMGSGKTTVCKVLEVLGVPVFYSDAVAKELMVRDTELVNAVKNEFGNEIYDGDVLNKQLLAENVFGNNEKLEVLNGIVHPAVGRAFDSWLTEQDEPIVAKEAAILIESGAYKMVDKIITVEASEKVRIKRIQLRDGLSEEEIRSRMKMQLTKEERIDMAHYVIENDGDALILPQIIEVYKRIKDLASE